MPYASADGAKLHYEVSGEGSDTLLLIMGLGGHASEWGEAFLAPLRQRFRVVCMDNRGIGRSETEHASWSMRDMANDACAVLDAVGAVKAHVLGISMGGMITQTLGLEHPERVRRLILMSTSFGGAESVGPEPAAIALFALGPLVPLAEQRRQTLRTITAPGFAEQNPELVERLVQDRVATPTKGRVFKAQLEAILQSDRSQRVTQLHAPTLVIHGTHDSLIPVDNGKLLVARIPGAELLLLPHCGHMPHVEQPVQLTQGILRFLLAG